MLESHIPLGAVLPDPDGYGVAAVLGRVICAAAAVTAVVLPVGGTAPSRASPPRAGSRRPWTGRSGRDILDPAGGGVLVDLA
jgi:hypothetical protein